MLQTYEDLVVVRKIWYSASLIINITKKMYEDGFDKKPKLSSVWMSNSIILSTAEDSYKMKWFL